MQTPSYSRSFAPQAPVVTPRHAAPAPRSERQADESGRQVSELEPHWMAAIDAATD